MVIAVFAVMDSPIVTTTLMRASKAIDGDLSDIKRFNVYEDMQHMQDLQMCKAYIDDVPGTCIYRSISSRFILHQAAQVHPQMATLFKF